MDEKKRKKRRLVRVDWDDESEGEWNYVAIANLKVMPGSALEAGGKVRMVYGGRHWTGKIAAKKRRCLAFGESPGLLSKGAKSVYF